MRDKDKDGLHEAGYDVTGHHDMVGVTTL